MVGLRHHLRCLGSSSLFACRGLLLGQGVNQESHFPHSEVGQLHGELGIREDCISHKDLLIPHSDIDAVLQHLVEHPNVRAAGKLTFRCGLDPCQKGSRNCGTYVRNHVDSGTVL